MNTNPALSPRCSSSCSDRSSENRPRTVATTSAESTNESAFRPKTIPAPMTASSTPPTAGPSMIPAFAPTWTRPFAQARSSLPTRFGIAACEADQNGVSTTAVTNPIASRSAGSSTNAIAPNAAAPARSEAIITFRRSNRSPSTPPSGANSPLAPNVSRSDADSHAADPVRS